MDGWKGGWVVGKAGLRIAYSNQQGRISLSNLFSINKPKMTRFLKIKFLTI